MPGLEDDSIDFPQVYRAVAILIRSIALPDMEIDALLQMVDVSSKPKITPKMKLDKALAVLDEEAGDA